jgi:hypothetical protein
VRRRVRRGRAGAALLTALLAPALAVAQVSEDGGPLTEHSASVSSGSRPVGEGSLTVREGSVGSMISGPVRDPGTPSMISGPVSEVSRGAVTSDPPPAGAGLAAERPVGAVAREAERPVGVALGDGDLAELQRRLRAVREAAEAEAPSADADLGAAAPQP